MKLFETPTLSKRATVRRFSAIPDPPTGMCCGRRDFLTGMAALVAGAVLSAGRSAAQDLGGAGKPSRIDLIITSFAGLH